PGCAMLREDGPPGVTRLAAPDAPVGQTFLSAGDQKADRNVCPMLAEEQEAAAGQGGTYQVPRQLPGPGEGLPPPALATPSGVRPIRLPDILALAGVENPVILLAEQAVQASLALQLQARVLLLPNLNVGADYDNHTGPLQSSFGAIRTVN